MVADREKVIKGLEHCGFNEKRGCVGCPYSDECGDFGSEAGIGSLCTDALALLREQEPQETRLVHRYSRPGVYADLWLYCEVCGGKVDDNTHPKFCPECGRKVKWNG